MTRPLSPHIQIYRWTLTMTLSILHRATGVALYGGTAGAALWLASIAQGGDFYINVQALLTSDIGLVILFLYNWALLHHLVGGLRHFVWDMGAGFQLSHVEWGARLGVVVPLAATLFIWWEFIWREFIWRSVIS